jgi:hypothetical protein
MEFLASDALNGRGSGTRDEWIAATYIGSQMRQWGLEPLGDAGGFVEQIEIERLEVAAPPIMTVEGRRFTHGNEIRVVTMTGPRISGPVQKYIANAAVRPGAILLMPTGAAAVAQPNSAVANPTAGAAAVLSMDTSDQPRPGGARLPTLPAAISGVKAEPPSRAAQVALNKDAYAAVAALAEGAVVTIEAETKLATKSQTWNAVGRLTGSDPGGAKEVILLSAHLDHLGNRPPREGSTSTDTIYNGADDDASGSIAVLELARALAGGPRPKRTIVFAWFGSEEGGGYGSRYFADRPVVPLSEIVANLEFEMIGRADAAVPPHTLWLTGFERSTLGPALAKQGAKLVQDPHPEQNFFMRSDNIQFARRGVVAHTVSSYGLHKEYHQPTDDIRAIDFAHMTDSIRSMLAPIQWLASSGFKPEWLPGKKP